MIRTPKYGTPNFRKLPHNIPDLGGSVWIISFAVTSGVFTLSVAMLWTLLVLNDQQMKEPRREQSRNERSPDRSLRDLAESRFQVL